MQPNSPTPGHTLRDNGVRERVAADPRLELDRGGERAPLLSEVDAARVKQALRDARTWLAQHRIVTTALGFGLGFVLGRLLRRS